jgi:ubiquinone/menaquinone biosynthesis C-methylase UbiE
MPRSPQKVEAAIEVAVMTTRDTEVGRIEAVYAKREIARKTRFRPGRDVMLADRDRQLAEAIRNHLAVPLDAAEILDVGCGEGGMLAWLQEAGARAEHLHGIDLLPTRIERARERHPHFDFLAANAEEIPFGSGRFDLLIVMTVFSSILSQRMAENVAAEMTRVLRPGGLILWYDMRYPNPWNPNIRAMTRLRVASLFPTFEPALHSATLIPQIVSLLGGVSATGLSALYPWLTIVPPLRSHYLGILRSPEARVGH